LVNFNLNPDDFAYNLGKMIKLPLFPLNTVLFPGIPFQLHIFEERYKKMVEDCIEFGEPFGVVLIKKGFEALGPVAEPHSVGCTAQIVKLQRMAEGRMNITVVGQERFRIRELFYDKPYLVGQVELMPLQLDDPKEIHREGARLRPLVLRYLQILSQAGEVDIESTGLPENPMELAYLAAYILQTPLHRKQDLLNQERAVGFMSSLGNLYPREIALLEAIMTNDRQENQGVFSLN
jgi:Lon protease-like protein